MDGGRISALVVSSKRPGCFLAWDWGFERLRTLAHLCAHRYTCVRRAGAQRFLRRAARSPRAGAVEVLYCLGKLSESWPASARDFLEARLLTFFEKAWPSRSAGCCGLLTTWRVAAGKVPDLRLVPEQGSGDGCELEFVMLLFIATVESRRN